MRRLTQFCLFCLLVALLGGGGGIAFATPPTVQDVVNEFSPTNYQDVLQNKLYTRLDMNRSSDYGRQHDLCRDAISNEFYRVGYVPQFDTYIYHSPYGATIHGCSVIAVKPGLLNPSNEIYVVSGHYDSVDNPGADDDGSGVAGVLEMARVFSQHNFARTMVFCAFDSEEIETWPGSSHYVSQHLTDNIKGMVSMDMIAHEASGSFSNMVYLEGGLASLPLRNDLKSAIETYGGGLTVTIMAPPGDTSDHVSFADAGFQACAFAEANWHNNPTFHQPTDSVDTAGNINWTFAGKMCRSAIGFFATKLQLVEVDFTPKILSIVHNPDGSASVHFTGVPGSKYATDFKAGLTGAAWSAMETNTAAGDGSFTTTDPLAASRPSGFYRARFVPAD